MGPTWDCRGCRAERKREERRKRAEYSGRAYRSRADAKKMRDDAKAERAAQRAMAPTPQERARLKLQRVVARQRERYNTDPEYQARVKARKIRRKHALHRTQVEPVNRELVAARDRWLCSICGGEVTRKTWSLDHVVPLTKGGHHTYANVALAHRRCNSSKGNKTA